LLLLEDFVTKSAGATIDIIDFSKVPVFVHVSRPMFYWCVLCPIISKYLCLTERSVKSRGHYSSSPMTLPVAGFTSSLARKTGHGLIGVIVVRCLFGCVALNAKARIGAAVEKRSHRANDADPQGIRIAVDQRHQHLGGLVGFPV
jgi:hypothetical protein